MILISNHLKGSDFDFKSFFFKPWFWV